MTTQSPRLFTPVLPLAALLLSGASALSAQNVATFSCGASPKSAIHLSAQTLYTGGPGKTFGWDLHAAPSQALYKSNAVQTPHTVVTGCCFHRGSATRAIASPLTLPYTG